MLTCKRGTEEDVADLGPGLIPSIWPGLPTARWSKSQPEGRREGKALGWYRGDMSGKVDVILLLQEKGYTKIAKQLQDHYGFTDNGSYSSGTPRKEMDEN